MRQCWWVLVVLFIGVALFFLTHEPGTDERDGAVGMWKKVGGDYEVDVSGLVFLERRDGRTSFLVCHDNK
ncbi:hypothetical protein GF324_14285, partial [bacterium]|nr:hypothetical protein [bacterium]